jgi:hypothetical protein
MPTERLSERLQGMKIVFSAHGFAHPQGFDLHPFNTLPALGTPLPDPIRAVGHFPSEHTQ